MKKFKFTLVLLMTILFTSAFADVFDDIGQAIKTGNSRQIGSLFNSTVDLTILGQEDVYSKAQAEQILKDFFSKNPPRDYVVKHQGTSKEGARYVIGNFISTQGKSFRAYYLLRQLNGNYYIQELRFETEFRFEK